MYELVVLSLLMRQPAHGYLIAKAIGNLIGPIAKASNGRIYPLLSKLEAAGFIVAADNEQNGRQIHTFRITDTGRQRFHESIMNTSSSQREYQELFAFKVTVFPLIRPEERLVLIDHYIHYCRAHTLHLANGMKDLQTDSAQVEADAAESEALLNVLEHRIRQWELEIAWAQSLKAANYPIADRKSVNAWQSTAVSSPTAKNSTPRSFQNLAPSAEPT